MANPFKNKARRESFEKILKMYQEKHKTLFTRNGSRNLGNSFSAHFWMGYNGDIKGHANFSACRASRETIGYVFFRAGQEAARQERRKKTAGWS